MTEWNDSRMHCLFTRYIFFIKNSQKYTAWKNTILWLHTNTVIVTKLLYLYSTYTQWHFHHINGKTTTSNTWQCFGVLTVTILYYTTIYYQISIVCSCTGIWQVSSLGCLFFLFYSLILYTLEDTKMTRKIWGYIQYTHSLTEHTCFTVLNMASLLGGFPYVFALQV